MRSEFERWLGDVWLSDAEWDESKNTYSDSRIHCMWSAWQHQQSKVDELTKQRIEQGQRFNDQSQLVKDLEHKNAELQNRVDAVKQLIDEYRDPPTKDKTFQHALSIVADELEQALKGDEE